MSVEDDPKFTKNGRPDMRGQSEGSRSTRFASGDGRRRPGRPKGRRDEKSEVLAIRDMPVEGIINGRKRRISTRTAILLKMRDKALKGDIRAAQWMDAKFAQFEPLSVDPDLTVALLDEDLEILRWGRDRGLVDADTDTASAESASSPAEEDK